MTITTKKPSRALRALTGAGLSALAISASVHAGCNANYAYVGEICITAANYCPQDTIQAAGQIITISSNPTLYTLLGVAYGGDGVNTFALPDLRGRAPVAAGTAPGLSPVQLGQKRGAEMVVQSASQLATHSHSAVFRPNAGVPVQVTASTSSATSGMPQNGSFLAAANSGTSKDVNVYGDDSATVALGGVTGGENTGGNVIVAPAGESSPMNVLDPQLGLNFCIVTQGAFPPRQ